MNPTYFPTPQAWRAWLQVHHEKEDELLVGFHKVGSGTPSITWPQAVDQALCFGWIDGVRRRIDDARYVIRFTPRRPGSNWSAVNLRRTAVLKAEGLMKAPGLKAFAKRSEGKPRTYSYEERTKSTLAAALKRLFQAEKRAWAFFQMQAPSYQKRVVHWIATAKTEETKSRRLRRAIDSSSKGKTL